MKTKILLNRSGMSPDGTSRKGRYCLDPILSRLCLASLICLCMLTIGSGNVWGATAEVDDILWKEEFAGGSSSTTFSATSSWSTGTGTTMLDASDKNDISYSSSDAMLSTVSATGVTGSHVWLNKSTTGYFQVDDIPVYNATKVQISLAKTDKAQVTIYYKRNGTDSDWQTGATIAKTSTSGSTSDISVTQNTTISIKFQRASNKDAQRIDDLTLIATDVASGGGSTYTVEYANSITGGSVQASSTSGISANTEITLTPNANTGYEFTSWNVYKKGDNTTTVTVTNNKFSMPAYNVVVDATFSCKNPVFGTDLSTETINYSTSSSPTALTVAASANNATINYQWQKSSDNSNWLDEGTNSSSNTSLTPSVASAGTTYYRVIATNATSGCSSAQTTSNVATVVVTAPTPATITLNNYSGTAAPTNKYSGDTWNLPTTNSYTCGELTFVGWSTVTIANSATKPSSNYYEKGASVTLGATNTFYAVFAESSSGGTTTKTDELTYTSFFSACTSSGSNTNGSYTTFSGKSGSNSDAVYAGQIFQHGNGSANCKDYIQMRTTNSNSGIITTTSGGKAKKVTVEWNSTTANAKVLNIYGKSTAYSAASDLYADATDGDLLGTITKGTSTEYTITGDYEHIGLRSSDGSVYFDAISIDWQAGSGTSYSDYTTNCVNMAPVYLDASQFGDASGAKFAVYSWKNGSDPLDDKLAEAFMTKVTSCHYDHLYEGEMPDHHDRVIFLRNSDVATTPTKNTEDATNFWNKTVDVTTEANKDLFTIASGGAGNTYTGSWSVYTTYYSVTFDKNGVTTTNTWPSDQCVASGSAATNPNMTPLTMGKTFVGWYQEAGGANAWNFSTTISEATTIYAKWNDVATKTIYLDASADLPADPSAKKWDVDNVVLFAHAYINNTGSPGLYTDVKMTAVSSCQPHVYTCAIPGNATHVSFARCANGTTELPVNWTNPPVYNQIAGKTVESGKDYYVIDGWGSATLQNSAFTPTSYTISFAAGDYGSGVAPADDSKACGVAYVLPNTQVFTRNGYTMDGWSINANGSTNDYNLGGSYTTEANQTFYPHWREATYTVTLTTNGGTINAGNVENYTYGTGATLPTNVTKDHATFQGWYASSTFDGDRVYTIGTTEYGDKQYYAKWEDVKWTVTWKANGATVRTDANIVDGNKVASVPSAPSDLTTGSDGCDAEFVGWVIEANDPGALSISSQSSTPSGMFTNVAGSPAITANTTFIAIYRQEQ